VYLSGKFLEPQHIGHHNYWTPQPLTLNRCRTQRSKSRVTSAESVYIYIYIVSQKNHIPQFSSTPCRSFSQTLDRTPLCFYSGSSSFKCSSVRISLDTPIGLMTTFIFKSRSLQCLLISREWTSMFVDVHRFSSASSVCNFSVCTVKYISNIHNVLLYNVHSRH
jgi:hypothetical protein